MLLKKAMEYMIGFKFFMSMVTIPGVIDEIEISADVKQNLSTTQIQNL